MSKLPVPFKMQNFQKSLIQQPKKTQSNLDSIGTVISSTDGHFPNVVNFHFIISDGDPYKKILIRQGQYVITITPEGFVIGAIEQIHVNNEYFQNAQTIKSFNTANVNLQNFIPSEQWECYIAEVNVLGLITNQKSFIGELDPKIFQKIEKVGCPTKPGNSVFLLEGDYLKSFLGLDNEGINIGGLKHHNFDVKLNLNRLFNKHVAVLAQSGAGKSYLISVILEELLNRPKEMTPGMILIDVHGEYQYLAEKYSLNELNSNNIDLGVLDAQKRIQQYNASFLQIGVPNLSEYDFQHFQSSISMPQVRELRKAISICRKKYNGTGGYDIKDIIFTLSDDPEGNSKVKETLIGWLQDLDHLGIFAKNDSPSMNELVRLGELSIINMNTIISQRKKQILIHHFTSQLFQARRNGKVPPFILFLEEAHNFLPEAGGSNALAKNILETIAREGRKFFAQLVLVSQRPVHLSTTALSQCNTQIIMRITNPYDLDHIKATSEALTKDAMRIVSTLPTGNALIMGAALNYPIFVQIRGRKIPNLLGERSLSEICKNFINRTPLPMTDENKEKLLEEVLDLEITDIPE